MPTFDIVKKSRVGDSYRVARVSSDFDLQATEIAEHFQGSFEFPEKWNVGLIVGASGTGKTTIARELFGDNVVNGYDYTHASVIDDMPENRSFDDITRCFYSVGFGSVPSWLKPYDVLSNGEKMRCDMARALLSDELVCFDEFTSVVDRNVAITVATAVQKAVRRDNKQFVAVSCHRDVIEWLQPDWVFDTDVMRPLPVCRNDQNEFLTYEKAASTVGKCIANITT